MTVAGHSEIRTTAPGGLDQLVIVPILGNNPELTGDLDHVRPSPADPTAAWVSGVGKQNFATRTRRSSSKVAQCQVRDSTTAFRHPPRHGGPKGGRRARCSDRCRHHADLVQQDPIQAKAQIAKHLDGDLTISPQPSPVGEKHAEIIGRAKQNSLLSDQEAVCLQMVAGAGFEPATFGL